MAYKISMLEGNQTLRNRVPVQLPASFANARLDASDDTGLLLATFPQTCPWTERQILGEAFWPEEQSHELPQFPEADAPLRRVRLEDC